MKKLIIFLYISNKQSKDEINKTVPFTIASKSLKYLEINTTNKCKICTPKIMNIIERNVKDLYQWRDILCLWIRRQYYKNGNIIPNWRIRFMWSLSKSEMPFFLAEVDKLILKFIWKCKRPKIAKTNMKKNEVGGFTLTDFKYYYKVTLFKKIWYWHKARCTDQWNKIESPEITFYIYGQLIFNRGDKIQWRKIIYQQMNLRQLDVNTGKNVVGFLTSYT